MLNDTRGGAGPRPSILFFLVLLALLPSAIPPPAHAQTGSVRSQDYTQTAVADFAAGQKYGVIVTDLAGGELRLASGVTSGVYTSTVLSAHFSFTAVVPHWRAVVPDGAALKVEMRVHSTSNGWSDWHIFDEIDEHEKQFYPEMPLLKPDSEQFQYRLTLTAAGQTPILDEITLTVIDASAGPTTSQARTAIQNAPQPAIIPRSGWGADENLMTWPPEYRAVEKIVVHHTVSANGYDEDNAAGLVRAIYYYHAVTRGWGDIGYNYLVDDYGNVYEGRYGGPGVVGGHVYGYNYGSMGIGAIGSYGNTPASKEPSQETLTAIADLAAWEANRSYIHPLESSPFYDTTTPNLAGHRDYPPHSTACPGDYLYAALPGLRQSTWDRIVTYTDEHHVEWLSWNTPPRTLLAAETYSPAITVRNTGWLTWPQAGVTNSVRLGYHWLDSGGLPVSQPPEDDHRGPLDYDLAFGHTYNFEPALLTTPITPGFYTLAWDMAHEGVDWFHDANLASPLLTMTVSITNTPPVTISGQVVDVRGQAVSEAQIALPNWITATTAGDGAYALSPLARASYTLTAAAEGYAPLAPAYNVDAGEGDLALPFVLASDDFVNLIANKDFESGLDNWARGGITESLPISTSAAHTGLGAAQLGGDHFNGTVWLSQTLNLPSNALSPTLSLFYRVPISGTGATFQVTIVNDTTALTHTLPLTANHWTPFQTPLPDNLRGPLDLQLRLTQSSNLTPTTVLVDEVWMGYQELEPYLIYLPLTLKAHTDECSEQIANGDFEETAVWEILDTDYPAAYSAAQARGGSRSMRTGIEPGGDNTYSYSSAQQTVAIPADTASATLTYWWYPASKDADDHQYLLLMDQEGSILDSLLWTNANDQTWLQSQADLTAYTGMTLILRFGVYNNGSNGLTRMYVDDVSLQTCP